MSDFVKNKNYDDVFLRDLYSAICYFFTDILSIKNVVNGEAVRVKIPILPSFIGSEDYMRDFFVNQDKICCGESPSVVLNKYPSGRVILSGGFNIDDSVITSNGVRTKREVNVDNYFIEEMETKYSRNTIIGLNTSFNIEFRCNTNIERMKIFQSILDNLHKERTFMFSSCGIHKIPASITVANSHRLETGKQFSFSDYEGFSVMTTSFELSTFYVVDDGADTMTEANRVNKPSINITERNI